jgi:putative transcriptional regulator
LYDKDKETLAMSKRHKIVDGLREAVSYAKGTPSQVRLSSYNIPENIDVKKLREDLGMSQPEFALKFGFSLGTLRHWEQGRRYPDGAARVLLTVIHHSPQVVNRALEEEARKGFPQKQSAVG